MAVITDGCLTKQDADLLNAALAQSYLSGGALTAGGVFTADLTSHLVGDVTADGAMSVGGALTVTGALTVAGVLTSLQGPQTLVLTAITANGAIDPNTAATYVITKAGVAAMTLGAPTVTTDDGKIVTVTSDTTNAHTITATGLLGTGSVKVDVATFAAYLGAGVKLMAYQGKWLVLSSVGITFT